MVFIGNVLIGPVNMTGKGIFGNGIRPEGHGMAEGEVRYRKASEARSMAQRKDFQEVSSQDPSGRWATATARCEIALQRLLGDR